MLVEVELYQVVITEGSNVQSIVLKEKHTERVFVISIGYNEAMAIDRKIKEFQVPRPLTHDLLQNLIDALGGKLRQVVLNAFKEGTYYALLIIEQRGKNVEVDARPSDAIALAVRIGCPIFAEEEVIRKASEGE